jgi:hypothetical protein
VYILLHTTLYRKQAALAALAAARPRKRSSGLRPVSSAYSSGSSHGAERAKAAAAAQRSTAHIQRLPAAATVKKVIYNSAGQPVKVCQKYIAHSTALQCTPAPWLASIVRSCATLCCSEGIH